MGVVKNHESLERFFSPKTVAVIGASERLGSVGRTVFANLLSAPFKGRVYPVNPRHRLILDQKAYPNIQSIPEAIDLAIVATKAETVPQIIAECVEAKVPAAVILSSGFKETGAEGIGREEEILFVSRGKMRIIGPNCLGIMCPGTGLNATFAHGMAMDGHTAFISQSGALCTAVLDWSLREKIGFSAFGSVGSMIDVDWGDLLDYFGQDPKTHRIVIYMESIVDAKAFCKSASRLAGRKPIILLKSGRSNESSQAAISHTGALVGDDAVFSAAMERVGVLRVDTLSDLFNMMQMISKQPFPKGPCLSVVTNAGGPGVIATDALIQSGAKLTPFSDPIINALDAILPPYWSHHNPVDVLGDAQPEVFTKAVEIALSEPKSDAILAILTPQEMTDPAQTARRLTDLAKPKQPILASWMGGEGVEEGRRLLRQSNIPVFEYPDEACKTFGNLWKYLKSLETLVPEIEIKPQPAHEIILKARQEQRTILDEVESKRLLEAYGIPVVPTEIARNVQQAIQIAQKIGFPVVLKVYAHHITHKSDVGGVKLNLKTEAEVEQAFKDILTSIRQAEGVSVQPMIDPDGFELIVGSYVDDQFGPIVLFGSGGRLTEVYQDRSLAMPPLDRTLAQRLMQETKIVRALQKMRGQKSVDFGRIEEILEKFSRLILQQLWIKECDINPLFISKKGAVALDARIILHDSKDLPEAAFKDSEFA